MDLLQLVNRVILECGISSPALTATTGLTGELGRVLAWTQSAWMDIQSEHQDWQWMRRSASFATVAGKATYNYGGSYLAITSITQAGGTATVTTTATHSLTTGDAVTITGANQSGYNLTAATVTVTGASTFTYAVDSGTASPATGTITYTDATNILLTDFGMWAKDTFRNYQTSVGLLSEIFMDSIDYETWRNSYQYGALRYTQTRPMQIAVSPAKAICLGPTAAAGYTVTGDYYSVPAELSSDTSSPTMPDQYHMAIVYRAMMSYGAFEAAPEVYQRGELEYNKMMRRIALDRLPTLTFSGALA